MEKFGIFELLDTLSALSAPQKDGKTDENSPSAANADPAPDQTPSPQTPVNAGADQGVNLRLSAFESLLARHDGISKRIDKNK